MLSKDRCKIISEHHDAPFVVRCSLPKHPTTETHYAAWREVLTGVEFITEFDIDSRGHVIAARTFRRPENGTPPS